MAAEAQAKVIIKGENNISAPVKSAKKDLTDFQSAASKVGSTLKSAFTITAIVAAVSKLKQAVVGCFNEFSTAERSYKQLALALNDTAAYQSAVSTIETLSRQTLTAKGDIEGMVSELAALGKSSKEIDSISTAAVALSNVTGKDLNTSMTTLLNTYNGTTTQLKKIGIDTSNLTKEELEQGAAVQLVIDKFGELSKQMAEDSTQQHITNIKNTIGDIKQHIGGIFNYQFGSLIANIDKGLQGMYGNITKAMDWIAATIKNFPAVIKALATALGKTLLTIFSWDFIKGSFKLLADNVAAVIQGLIEIIPKSIPQLFNFIFHKAVSLIDGIMAWLLDKAEIAIEAIVNAFARSKFGKWLGIDEIEVNLGSAAFTEASNKQNDKANAAANELANNASSIWNSVKDTSKEIMSNTAAFLDKEFGETWSEFGDSFIDIVKPTFDEIQVAAEVVSEAGSVITDAGAALTDAGEAIVESTTPDTGSSSSTSTEAAYDIMGTIKNAFGDLATEFDSIIAAFQAGAWWVLIIVEIIKGFAAEIRPFIDAVLNPIKEALQGFGKALAQMSIMNSLVSIVKGILPLLNSIFGIITPFVGILTAITDTITQLFMPILKGIVIAFTAVSSTIEWVCQKLAFAITWFLNKISFGNVVQTSDPGNYKNFVSGRISAAQEGFDSTYAASTADTSTTAAVQNASYSGATSVTINIYQEAPVVGDGGMLQFAQMIRDQFENLDYYGV